MAQPGRRFNIKKKGKNKEYLVEVDGKVVDETSLRKLLDDLLK